MSSPLSEPLFHASRNVLKKGSIIRPLDKLKKGNIIRHLNKHETAWAGDRARADHHAKLLHEKYGLEPFHQLALWHPVYEVEPLKTDKTIEQVTEAQPQNMKTFKSAKGFRVKGFSHLVEKEH